MSQLPFWLLGVAKQGGADIDNATNFDQNPRAIHSLPA